VPISRKEEGVTLSMSVANNIVMTNIMGLGSGMFLDRAEERKRAAKWMTSLSIRSPSMDTEVNDLSGGNQQKVVLAKWLESGARVFLMNEPTRGIDVGAKVEIYKLMENLCEAGGSVLMSSTELPEILSIPDRILVMARGRLTAEFTREEADKEKLIHAASM
jgi:ABC-type sugar transport system ATPase subunit